MVIRSFHLWLRCFAAAKLQANNFAKLLDSFCQKEIHRAAGCSSAGVVQ
jgi:hypothetical protein